VLSGWPASAATPPNRRLTARTSQLGFADLRVYLADRLLVRGWLLAEVTAELGAHRRTVRRLMDQHGIRRIRRIPRELAAGERGRQAQSAAWQARRAARLTELGFPNLAGYLQRRYGEQGWVGQADAGRAWGWAALAGRRAGTAGPVALTPGRTAPAPTRR
jgi:hypothetical protein